MGMEGSRVTYGDVAAAIEAEAPLSLQESYDNSGLQLGRASTEVTGIVVCFDVTEAVLEEAKLLKANLVVSHHPVLFHVVKELTGRSRTSRLLLQALEYGIGLYAAHTSLDAAPRGVNWKMAQMLGLEAVQPLQPVRCALCKVVTFVPPSHAEGVREAMFAAGAGCIGLYSKCSYNLEGEGTFFSPSEAEPYIGAKDSFTQTHEVRIETVAPADKVDVVVSAMRAAHPYQEVAYDVYPLHNKLTLGGLGAVGQLPEAESLEAFIARLQRVFAPRCIRVSNSEKRQIARVALCGGAGVSLLPEAERQGADIMVTGDCKYHDFQRGPGETILCDIGHRESEHCAVQLLHSLLAKKFTTFAIWESGQERGPITYYLNTTSQDEYSEEQDRPRG